MARVQYDLTLTPQQAFQIHNTYKRTYKMVPEYWKRQKILSQQRTYISNLLGRRIHFVPQTERDLGTAWSYEATAINFPIQSMGAEQRYLALMVAKTYLPKYDAYFYFDMHDGMFFIAPHAKAEALYRVLQPVLSNLPYKRAWDLDLPVRFPVDGKLGPSWGELKELKLD